VQESVRNHRSKNEKPICFGESPEVPIEEAKKAALLLLWFFDEWLFASPLTPSQKLRGLTHCGENSKL
jgi:hypothetical protein